MDKAVIVALGVSEEDGFLFSRKSAKEYDEARWFPWNKTAVKAQQRFEAVWGDLNQALDNRFTYFPRVVYCDGESVCNHLNGGGYILEINLKNKNLHGERNPLFLFFHEMRHAWQRRSGFGNVHAFVHLGFYGKYIGFHLGKAVQCDVFTDEDYYNLPWERDANDFAAMMLLEYV